MLKLSFSFTDEFNQESTMTKTFTEDVFEVTTTFDLLVDEFKNFLIASGFPKDMVDSIIIEEEKLLS